MAESKRRVYVAPDVKQYGAVEEVTQMILRSGPGDVLSTLMEIASGEDDIEGCPIWVPSCGS